MRCHWATTLSLPKIPERRLTMPQSSTITGQSHHHDTDSSLVPDEDFTHATRVSSATRSTTPLRHSRPQMFLRFGRDECLLRHYIRCTTRAPTKTGCATRVSSAMTVNDAISIDRPQMSLAIRAEIWHVYIHTYSSLCAPTTEEAALYLGH
jgi:hypothetical protein